MTVQSTSPGTVDAPTEPTKEMAIAGRKALAVVADRMETAKLLATSSIDFWQRVGHEPANEIYRAMIEARPSGAAQGSGMPVAWRYQHKEGWGDIWRCSTIPVNFETPADWIVQPLYAVPPSPVAGEVPAKCDCAVMCQDLGIQGGCRYIKPSRTVLRKLVDLTWNHVTESQEVPSTNLADELIDRASAMSSTEGK